jgi:6-methylsalicylate decarboxylase
MKITTGRREFLLQGSAAVSATLASSTLAGKMAVGAEHSPTPDRPVAMMGGIDVHAHYLPDFYVEALAAAGLGLPDGLRHLPSWTAESALRLMDELGVQTSMLSISSPGVHFGDDAKARALARRLNEYAARLTERSSGRFGYLASVPLPDVANATAEAVFALDSLHANGLIVETNHHGVYLGDPQLDPFYAELNSRSAVVLIHPTSPACSCSSRLAAALPAPILEFMFETTRSVTDLIISGVLSRYPNIRFIVPHAGAALSVLANRVELGRAVLVAAPDSASAPSFRDGLRQLHFDLAGAPVPDLLRSLLSIADPKRIHYGSDYPFTPAPACQALLQRLRQTDLLDGDSLRNDMWRDNSLRLFPNLEPKQAL